MPVPQRPPPASHSAATTDTTGAPGPNPEAVHGTSATPEEGRGLWEMELPVRACGKWSSGRAGMSSESPGSLEPRAALPARLSLRADDSGLRDATDAVSAGAGDPHPSRVPHEAAKYL